MAVKRDNVYQIKFKLIPDKVGYKSSFTSGIVLAKTQESAISESSKNIEKALLAEPFKVQIKVQSIVKLRQDFFYVADDVKKQG